MCGCPDAVALWRSLVRRRQTSCYTRLRMKMTIAAESNQNPPPMPITPYSAGVPPPKYLANPIIMPNSPPRTKTQVKRPSSFFSTVSLPLVTAYHRICTRYEGSLQIQQDRLQTPTLMACVKRRCDPLGPVEVPTARRCPASRNWTKRPFPSSIAPRLPPTRGLAVEAGSAPVPGDARGACFRRNSATYQCFAIPGERER